MDPRLLDWARAVKARREDGARRKVGLPTLWLFTDQVRLADPLAAVSRLPRGSGVVFRHDGDPRRATLGRALARLCRARRIALVVAGDARLAAALGAGMHLRDARFPGPARPVRRRGALLTSSAHGVPALRRAVLARADLAFLSPVFATASHPGAPALGPARWTRLARSTPLPVVALGGVDERTIRLLPRRACAGMGAIGALA